MQTHLNDLKIPLNSNAKQQVEKLDKRTDAKSLIGELKSLVQESKDAKDDKAKAIVEVKKNKILLDTQGVNSAFGFVGELAAQTKHEGLFQVATIGASSANFFSAGVQLLLDPTMVGAAALDPITTAAKAFISIVGIIKSKKKNKSESKSESPLNIYFKALFKEIRFISEQIHAMHKDMWEMHKENRELFAKSFENQKMMLEIFCEGFASLENKIDSNHADLNKKINQLSAFITNGFKLLANDLQLVALQNFRDLLDSADARIGKTQIMNQAAAIEEIADKLYRWSKPNGKSFSPLYSGTRWLPENPIGMEAWLNEVVFNNNSISSEFILGLLVEYYSRFLNINLPEKDSVFNTYISNESVSKYMEVEKAFGEFIPNLDLHSSEMTESYDKILPLLKSFRTKPQLYIALFDAYENILRKIPQAVDQSMQAQNQALNRGVIERSHSFPTKTFEIENPFDLNTWAGQMPMISPLMTCPYGPNGDYRQFINYQGTPMIENTVRSFIPHERLGLGKVTFVYDANTHKYGTELNIYVDFIDDKNQTQRLLRITRGLVTHSNGRLDNTLMDSAWGVYAPQSVVGLGANIHAAINKIHEHLLAHRKCAIQNAATKIEYYLKELDFIGYIIKHTMEVAGFQPTEMQLLANNLWNSTRVLSHLRRYCEEANYNTPLPHTIFLENSIRDQILAKVNSQNTGYFKSDIYSDAVLIRAMLMSKAHAQKFEIEKKTNAIVLQASTSVTKIFAFYERRYKKLWSCKAYLDQVPSDEKDIIHSIADAGKSFEQLKKKITDKQINHGLIEELIVLIKSLQRIHSDLKLCSESYQKAVNDENFMFKDDISELKSLSTKLKSYVTKSTPPTSPFIPVTTVNRLNLILSKQVMRAKLDDKPVYFKRIPNNGTDAKNIVSGSCGYIACDTTREEVSKVIAANLTLHTVINFIGGQIDNDYKEESLKIDAKSFGQIKNLHMNLDLKQELDANIRKVFLNHLGKEKSQSASELISEYKKLKDKPLPSTLSKLLSVSLNMKSDSDNKLVEAAIEHIQKADTDAKKAEQDYRDFILNADTTRSYLDANLQTEWMGMGVAAAWAMLTGKTLRIWCINTRPKLNEQDPDDLYFLERGSYIAPEQKTSSNIIHVIHTGNHFEKLQCVPAPSLQNNVTAVASPAAQGLFAEKKPAADPAVSSSAPTNLASPK